MTEHEAIEIADRYLVQAVASLQETFLQPELIPGHQVLGHKVAAYETHWIAGFEFLFGIVRWPMEGWRIYILRRPEYGPRSDNMDDTHRIIDIETGMTYVCVDIHAFPKTLTEARELALMWAQATARYIRTGQKFS